MKYYAMGNQKEALKALQQVTEAVDEMEAEIVQQAKEIDQLRKERDEARREVLEGMHPDLRHGYAAAKEWDCFKEETP